MTHLTAMTCTARPNCYLFPGLLSLALLSGCGTTTDQRDATLEEGLAPYYALARTPGEAGGTGEAEDAREAGTDPESTADGALARLVASVDPAAEDPHRYLLAIGIETYRFMPDIAYVDNSLDVVSEALARRFGISEANTVIVSGEDATAGYMSAELDTLLDGLGPQDILYFYYAGHALPGPPGDDAIYLLARDAQVKAYANAAITMDDLLARMDASDVGRVWGFMDTCFSGKADQNAYLVGDIAAIRIGPVRAPLPNSISLLHAAEADQYSNAYAERGHRLFSYYLAEGLALGFTDAKRLEQHVKKAVSRLSRRMGKGFKQTPRLSGFDGDMSDALP